MSCPTTKKLCNRLIISSAVTFADDTLVINLPAGSYANGRKYCVVVAQALPDTTTINAPVVFTIGADTTTTYPLINCDCTPVYACSINTRTRYSVCVHTDIESGVFKLMGRLPCSRCAAIAPALPIDTAAAEVDPNA